MISKHYPCVEIEIDEDSGTIELITPDNKHCVLCISNVKFGLVDDKFTAIKVDAESGKCHAIKDGVSDTQIQTELSDLFKVLYYNIKHNDEIIDNEAFLKLATSEIKKFIAINY